jgi:MoxR-like ATPase
MSRKQNKANAVSGWARTKSGALLIPSDYTERERRAMREKLARDEADRIADVYRKNAVLLRTHRDALQAELDAQLAFCATDGEREEWLRDEDAKRIVNMIAIAEIGLDACEGRTEWESVPFVTRKEIDAMLETASRLKRERETGIPVNDVFAKMKMREERFLAAVRDYLERGIGTIEPRIDRNVRGVIDGALDRRTLSAQEGIEVDSILIASRKWMVEVQDADAARTAALLGVPPPGPGLAAVTEPKPQSIEERLYAQRDLRLRSADPRPATEDEVIGQDAALASARAILGSSSPGHMLFLGPPGIGKTTVARLAHDIAKKSGTSAFASDAPFVEIDCTNIVLSEQHKINPITSMVLDGFWGNVMDANKDKQRPRDMPQINFGAAAKAHGGVLFLDEIGELPAWVLNALLKVLEDGKERIEASRYDASNAQYPQWVHEFFQHGIPAQFVLIGATTRKPSELPPALLSRCEVIQFRALDAAERKIVAIGTASKVGVGIDERAAALIATQTSGGRDAARKVQTAHARATARGSERIELDDVPPGVAELPPRAQCIREGAHVAFSTEPCRCARCGLRITPVRVTGRCACGRLSTHSVIIGDDEVSADDVCRKCLAMIGTAGVAIEISAFGGDNRLGVAR